jgi:outer membrane receptor protein involved in Fe transport
MTRNRFASQSAILIGLCTATAVAATAATPAASTGEADSLEEVVVTGSRLQAAGFNAPTPVTVVTAETIAERAPANLSDVLLQQPALRIQNGDTSRQGSGGTNANPLPQGQIVAPNLRNLGANRTLVLLNGHRVVPSEWDSQVDINMIPVGLVERIDIVTGGASAAYGADAVAGVTNVILRDKMEGIKFGAQTGFTQYGTGKQYTLNLSGGTTLMDGRLHLIGGVDANKTNPITNIYGKQWAQDEIGNFAGANNALTSYRVVNNAPATVITTNVEPASTAIGGLYIASSGQAYTFDVNGNPVAFSRGTVSSNGQLMIGSTSNYGHNLNNQVYLRSENSRYDVMGRASFDFTDRVNGYVEINQSRNLSFPFLGGEFNQSSSIAGNSPGIVVARTNPFVTPATLALIGTATTLNLGRIDTELSYAGISGNAARQDGTTRRFAAGLTGRFGETWTYDIFAQQGRAWALLQRNDYSSLALQKSVNGCTTPVVGAPGFTTTQQVATVAAYEALTGKTCAAFNPFGVGRASQASIDYIQNQSYSDQHMKQDAASVGFTGKPLHLPAGDLGVAFGLDWRQEGVDAPVDPASRAGSGLNALVPAPLANTVAEVFGHYHVHEGYLEIGVPVVKDKFLAKSLDLNAAGRVTRYELAGTVRTWKLGASWEPIDSLRVRFTKSHDIRQGNMVELFRNGGPNNSNFNTTQLLVGTVGANGTVYNPAANTTVNPVGKVSSNAGTAVAGGLSVGGVANPNLRPEIANTVTGGLVWTKGGFNTSLDYYYIDVRDTIGSLGSQVAIDNCVAGDKSYCNDITFTQSSSVASGILIIGVPNDNLNRMVVQGFDYEISYGHQVGPGRLTVRSLMNYQPHNQTITFATGQTQESANTLGGQPKFGYNVSLNYRVGRWASNLQVRGFGARLGNNVTYNADGSINSGTTLGPEDGAAYAARVASAAAVVVGGVTVAQAGTVAASTNTINKNRWPGAYYVNGSFNYDVNEHVTMFLNVDNLLDKQPPSLALNASVYDFIGRSYRFGVRGNF